MEFLTYQMKRGKRLEDMSDEEIDELAKEHLEPSSIITDYHWKRGYNGSRKDDLQLYLDFIDPMEYDGKEPIEEVYNDALARRERFIKEVTGYSAEERKS